MSTRLRVFFGLLIVFLAVDALSWAKTYQIATSISQEEKERAAALASLPKSASIAQNDISAIADISLDGAWKYKQTGHELSNYFAPNLDTSAWGSMDLPKNWFLAGLNYHGVIWFRREFKADPAWKGRLVQLVFGGVDYYAQVWMNGQVAGNHQGYFQPFTFDITDLVRYDGPNELVVRVDSPYEEYDSVWPLNKTLVKGIFEEDRSRPGGAWYDAGQEYNTGGIWNSVSVRVSNFITLDQAHLQAAWPLPLPNFNNPELHATLAVYNQSDKLAAATISTLLQPENFTGTSFNLTPKTVTLNPGLNAVDVYDAVEGPRLWSPWDRGQPNLYRVLIQVSYGANPLASQQFLFGFREVRVDKDWKWTVNGHRYFIRGTNYASTQWLSQDTQLIFAGDLKLMREANLNLVRLDAHVEPLAFYDEADKAGLLVWQDFPLEGGYTEAPSFMDGAQRQMGDMVNLLYNHPSVVVWCAHSDSPWATPGMADYVTGYDSRQNSRLDQLLAVAAASLDSTRTIYMSTGDGDARVYKGWSEGSWLDYKSLPGAPFVSEFGAQALPDLPALLRSFSVMELFYAEGETRTRWEFQDFDPKAAFGVAKIDPGKLGPQSIDPLIFIKNSQDYQANLIQFAIESYRRAKFNPMQGIIQYMFVDEWPSVTFSVLDDLRQPKAGYAALQTAMQPVLPSISPSLPMALDGRAWVYPSAIGLGISLWVVNDNLEAYPDSRLEWTITDQGGKAVLGNSLTLEIAANEADPVYLLHNLALDKGSYKLEVTLANAGGAPLGQNEFLFEIVPPAEPTPTPTSAPTPTPAPVVDKAAPAFQPPFIDLERAPLAARSILPPPL